MDQGTIVMALVLVIYNVATTKLLSIALTQIDVRQAVQEKAPEVRSVPLTDSAGKPVPLDTSYSRVSGMIGAIVLATFFWAVGNVILYKAFADPSKISEFLSSIGTFFLGGASLFLPYAFNQLKEAFAPTQSK